jgi:hypothetical protein
LDIRPDSDHPGCRVGNDRVKNGSRGFLFFSTPFASLYGVEGGARLWTWRPPAARIRTGAVKLRRASPERRHAWAVDGLRIVRLVPDYRRDVMTAPSRETL